MEEPEEDLSKRREKTGAADPVMKTQQETATSVLASKFQGATVSVPAERMKATATALKKLREKEAKYKKLVIGFKKTLTEKQARIVEMKTAANQKDVIIKRLREEFKKVLEESDERLANVQSELDNARDEIDDLKESQAAAKSARKDGGGLLGEPRWVLQRVVEPSGAEAGRVWCLVGWKNGSSGWELEDTLVDRTKRDYGIELSMPPLTPNAESLGQLQDDFQSVKDDLKRVKQEFRRYRVRAELTIRQKESALSSSREELSRSFGKKVREIAGTDLAGDLKRARAEIAFFKRSLADTKRKCEEASGEVKRHALLVDRMKNKLEEAEREKEDWQLRYETFVQERRSRDLVEAVETAKTGGASVDYEHLQKEFEEYKKRAMLLVQEREVALQEANAALVRMGHRGNSASSSSSSTPLITTIGDTKGQYLRNIVIQYMATSDADVKSRLEIAMAEILSLTQSEKSLVMKRKQRETWGGVLFGGGT